MRAELVKTPRRMPNRNWRQPVVELLTLLAGDDCGASVLKRLIDGFETPAMIAAEIAQSRQFELQYKTARAGKSYTQQNIENDPGYIGLAEIDPAVPFDEIFDTCFSPLLGKRAEGFNILFTRLAKQAHKLLIIETGSLRIPGNWEGDGQSTFMFDLFVQRRHGTFYSIDINTTSIETARRACSSATNLINNDSVCALNTLSETFGGAKLDLLYLDSFDLDADDPMPSAVHHALELAAARPMISAGTMICVDDYAVGNEKGGKGLIVEMFLRSARAVELYSGYQKIWLVP